MSLDDNFSAELKPNYSSIFVNKKKKIIPCFDCSDTNSYLKDVTEKRSKSTSQLPWTLTVKLENIGQVIEFLEPESTSENIYLVDKPMGVNPVIVAILSTLFVLSAALNINLLKRIIAARKRTLNSTPGNSSDKLYLYNNMHENEERVAASVALLFDEQESLKSERAIEEEEAQAAKKIKEAHDQFVLLTVKRKANDAKPQLFKRRRYSQSISKTD